MAGLPLLPADRWLSASAPSVVEGLHLETRVGGRSRHCLLSSDTPARPLQPRQCRVLRLRADLGRALADHRPLRCPEHGAAEPSDVARPKPTRRLPRHRLTTASLPSNRRSCASCDHEPESVPIEQPLQFGRARLGRRSGPSQTSAARERLRRAQPAGSGSRDWDAEMFILLLGGQGARSADRRGPVRMKEL